MKIKKLAKFVSVKPKVWTYYDRAWHGFVNDYNRANNKIHKPVKCPGCESIASTNTDWTNPGRDPNYYSDAYRGTCKCGALLILHKE